MIKKINKMLFITIISSLILSINVNASASCVVGAEDGWKEFTTGYKNGNGNADTTQEQYCTTSSGQKVRIYCIDKGYHNEKNISTGCTFIEVTNTDYMTIANYNGFSTNFSFEKELAYRYYSYKTGQAKTPTSSAAYIKNGNIDSTVKSKVDKLKTTIASSTNTSDLISVSSTVSGSTGISTITVNYPGLTMSDVSVNNGATITNVTYSGNQSIFTVTSSIKSCKGSNFKFSVKKAITSTTTTTTNRVFLAKCSNQNYVVEIPSTVPVEDVIGNIDSSKNVSISDPSCNCNADVSGDYVCDGSGTNTEYIKETDNIKSCITSGNYNGSCSGDSIKKTNEGLSNNKYCAVYCKEEVEFNFPGEIKVSNGTYFKLDSGMDGAISVIGTRTCYAADSNSSNGIDQEQYFEDLKIQYAKIASAYNNYKEVEKKLELYNNAESKPSSCIYQTTDSEGKISNKTFETTYHYAEGSYGTITIKYDEKGSVTGFTSGSSTTSVKWGNSAHCSASGGTAVANGNGTDPKLSQADVEAAWQAVVTAIGELDKIVEEYEECYTWTNNYCAFDPTLIFSYEEVYNDEISGELQTDTITKGSTNAESGEYYTSVDDNYNGASESINKTTQYYISYNGKTLTRKAKELDVTHSYIKVTATSKKTFKNNTGKLVCTYHPYGTIVIGNSCSDSQNTKLLGGDGYVFPVALEHNDTDRKYNYNIEIKNIGAPGNDSVCTPTNRLAGDSSCSQYNQVTNKVGDAKYTCQYSSCPECEVTCVCPDDNPNCVVEDNVCKYVKCPTCTISCVGCTWSNGNSTFAYKQVSLTDVFNEDTTKVGYNWNTDSNVNKQAEKASDTLDEIEDEAQEVYKTPEYSYTLTPQTMAKIRAYNKAANSDNKTSLDNFGDVDTGGYNNDTLICTNGSECKSTFLNGLDKIVGTNNRIRNTKWTAYNDGSAWK
jgi:hypothetical protein